MKMMQVYWVETRGGDTCARPGNFVHRCNGSEVVIGFIGEVDVPNERVLIYLFEPTPAEAFAEVVSEQVEETVWSAKLGAILKADPEMARYWRDNMALSCSDN